MRLCGPTTRHSSPESDELVVTRPVLDSGIAAILQALVGAGVLVAGAHVSPDPKLTLIVCGFLAAAACVIRAPRLVAYVRSILRETRRVRRLPDSAHVRGAEQAVFVLTGRSVDGIVAAGFLWVAFALVALTLGLDAAAPGFAAVFLHLAAFNAAIALVFAVLERRHRRRVYERAAVGRSAVGLPLYLGSRATLS